MRLEYVVISIILMVIVLLVVIGLITGVIPGFEDFIAKISENPWK